MEKDLPTELEKASARLPISIGDMALPLEHNLRSIALTIAQRHCGDTTVKDGNMYQQLKMDNKLGSVLTPEDVVRVAILFEAYLWGEFSKGLAGEALKKTMDDLDGEIEEALKGKFEEHEPIRSSQGGKTK